MGSLTFSVPLGLSFFSGVGFITMSGVLRFIASGLVGCRVDEGFVFNRV